MKISKSEIVEEDGNVVCRFNVQGIDGPDTLWFSLDKEHKELLSDRSDAALVALLIPAMKAGEDIQVEGTVSERLYYTLSRTCQELLQTVIPQLKIINISAEDTQPSHKGGSGVAMGFSAGIDSFSALADHYYANQTSGFEVTHLLFNNVGSHGPGGEQLFRSRFEHIQPIVEDIGLPFIAVNSNLHSYYDGLPFPQTHTPRNTAVALLLQSGIGRFYYASAYHYKDIFIGPTKDIPHAEPALLPLFSTEALDVLHVGTEYTRVEKTLQVAEIEDSYEFLNVCIHPERAENCSTCSKCRRTMLTLEIAGKLERYSEAFDFGAYQRHKWIYLSKILDIDNVYHHELVDFANDNGFEFPLSVRLLAKTNVFTIEHRIKNKVINTPPLRKLTQKLLNIVATP